MESNTNTDEIVNRLLTEGRAKLSGPRTLYRFTRVDAYDRLVNDINRYPHAFAIACSVNRQMKAEKVWAIPYKLKERIGNFEFETLYKMSEGEWHYHFENPTPLHVPKLKDDVPKTVHCTVQLIGSKYDGDASLMWSGNPSGGDVAERFRKIYGVGPKISSLFANILATRFKIPFKDYSGIDISADIHVGRVFPRLGLVPESSSNEKIIAKARELSPDFPGLLNFPCWEIGRKWCCPKNPNCSKCYMNEVCGFANS